jgi:hypothetical protein
MEPHSPQDCVDDSITSDCKAVILREEAVMTAVILDHVATCIERLDAKEFIVVFEGIADSSLHTG